MIENKWVVSYQETDNATYWYAQHIPVISEMTQEELEQEFEIRWKHACDNFHRSFVVCGVEFEPEHFKDVSTGKYNDPQIRSLLEWFDQEYTPIKQWYK